MEAPPPPTLHQRYHILERLGQGRLAFVYRAQDERLRRTVLVHLMRPELLGQATLVQRFLEEAQRGAQRSHHGLLEVYDSGDVGGRPYMVTEDITGNPLADSVPLPLPDALSVLRTVASAVALAHSQGSPHPPVSSRNVWILVTNRPVLVENWLLPPAAAALDLAHYRAPERARGAPPSPATVVYALGILSWETVTGTRPFTGPTPEAIAQRQIREPLPSLSDESPRFFIPGLDRIIMTAAAPDPAQRYPAPVDFGRALDLWVDQATAQTGRLSILPRPRGGSQPVQVARRGDTTTRQAVRPPPAAPVLRTPPPVARRPVPPPMPAVAAEEQNTAAQPRRPSWMARRWQGLQRALVKRTLQVVLIIALIYAALIGIEQAVVYATGSVQRLDPSGWIMKRLPALPDLSWFERLDWLPDIPGLIGGSPTLVVTQPVNLRPEPSTENQPLDQLGVGTILRRTGGPVADAEGRPLSWIKVVVVEDGREGWIADQPDRVQEQ